MAKKPKGKPIESYLDRDREIEAKTIRADEVLWERVEALAEFKKVSVNALVVAALEKLCDEEEEPA